MSTKQLSADEIVAQALGSATGEVLAEVLAAIDEYLGDDDKPTDWFPGTVTPAHDGEFEVLHPVTGLVERAVYDTLFEAWSCEWQYPTWRGLRGGGAS